jgi:hypothetical protein
LWGPLKLVAHVNGSVLHSTYEQYFKFCSQTEDILRRARTVRLDCFISENLMHNNI